MSGVYGVYGVYSDSDGNGDSDGDDNGDGRFIRRMLGPDDGSIA